MSSIAVLRPPAGRGPIVARDLLRKAGSCGRITRMPDDKSGDGERRMSTRKDDRAEMVMGSSRTPISNLSVSGAFVAVLAGLRPDDSFSFELALDSQDPEPVKGRAVVRWADPGVGVGVQFDLGPDDKERLARYLDQLEEEGRTHGASPPDPSYDPPRSSTRRTIAIGTEDPDGFTRVWFRYLPPDKS